MTIIRSLTQLVVLLALSGCATLPTGPSVNVMPAHGKPFNEFKNEDTTCRQWAEQQMGNSVQENYDKNLATGAVVGTVAGAGVGAAIGSASGHAGAGAAIGAASGLLFGSAVGSNAGQASSREVQRRYDNAYVQCMYSYGNQVPGSRPRAVSAAPRPEVVAPPPPAAEFQEDAPPPPPEMAPGQYAPPPAVYVEEAPQFIYSPKLNMYVAVGVPYDLVYTGNEYFYFYGGRWFRGPYFNGPWVFATRAYFPPVLLRYRIDRIRHFRDMEFRRYERNRAHYDGRFHRPEFRR